MVESSDNASSENIEYQGAVANILRRKLEDTNLNLEEYDLAKLYQNISAAFARNGKLVLSTELSAKARVYSNSQLEKNSVTKNNNLSS